MKRLAALAVGAAVLLSGCAGTVVTKTGRESAHLYDVVLVMATVVFVGVEAAIIWQVVKYRRRRGQERAGLPPQIHGNREIEILWTALPSVIIAILLVLSMVVLSRVNAEPANPALNVQIVGYQWQWTFNYLGTNGRPVVSETAEGQDKGPTLYLPTGRQIHFTETSSDVIHSFFVPAFFFKRDVVPGRTNSFDETLQPGTEGKYVGECAEFCGEFHNAMTFTVQVMSPTDFDTWFKQEQAKQAKGPSCSPNGSSLQIAAKNIHFDTNCLAAPSGQAFTVAFDNKDSGVDHNFEIYSKNPAQGGTRLGGATGPADFFSGVATKTYDVGALKAGTYYFQCDVHATAMFGTFIVK